MAAMQSPPPESWSWIPQWWPAVVSGVGIVVGAFWKVVSVFTSISEIKRELKSQGDDSTEWRAQSSKDSLATRELFSREVDKIDKKVEDYKDTHDIVLREQNAKISQQSAQLSRLDASMKQGFATLTEGQSSLTKSQEVQMQHLMRLVQGMGNLEGRAGLPGH